MPSPNIITRRSFFERTAKLGLGVALSSLVDIPLVMKQALADGTIGRNGKKLLFIFLRGGIDGLNTLIPIRDSAYNDTNRPAIAIPMDPGTDYSASGPCHFPTGGATTPTFAYQNGLNLGNGFAALHPSLKFLAPLYNAGDLALLHRVAYPKQSRSHFDSQNYWETGDPNNGLTKDGILYRAMVESGLAYTSPLTGVSIQSSLPLILRGSKAAMTNLSDPTRYNLLGVPNNTAGGLKADAALREANAFPFPEKMNRELLELQYRNMTDTLSIFETINFGDAGNTFVDDVNTDGDTAPYYLFPTSNATNGGYALHANDPQKYVVDTNAYGFFRNLKAAALVLNKTDAIVAGTQLDGFDTHSNQGRFTGQHPNLLRRIAWAMYGLKKYFTLHRDKASWDNLVIVTLSEFGRTSKENSNGGTDHAEASVMFVAGGAVKGYNKGNATGVFGCNPNDVYNGQSVPWVTGDTGSMFGVSQRYLKRAIDYRSVLGEIVREHLGATPEQLKRIIPGYANAAENLQKGGLSLKDNTRIAGELDLV